MHIHVGRVLGFIPYQVPGITVPRNTIMNVTSDH